MGMWEFLIINYNPRNLFFYPDIASHTHCIVSSSRLARHFQNVFFAKVKCSNFTMKFSVSKFKLRFRMQNCSGTFFTELTIIFQIIFSIEYLYLVNYTFIRMESLRYTSRVCGSFRMENSCATPFCITI